MTTSISIITPQQDCPNCRAVLGRIVQFKNRLYFDDGIMLVLSGLRRCHCCGRMFHWDGNKANVDKSYLEKSDLRKIRTE